MRITILLAGLIFITTIASAQNGPADLRCEHLVSPIGVDDPHPRLSWRMQDNRQGAVQTFYQVLVSKDPAALESSQFNYWNSGKTASSQSLITYAGKKLEPFSRYYWKVKIWDKEGKLMSNSPVTWFETGMMQMSNWKGSWISDGGSIQTLPAPYFRKKFRIARKIKYARAYIAVAGLYELYFNGKKTGDHRLDPMYTRFDRRNLYVSYDITAQLQNGDNAIGVILGNGWYNHQSLAVWNFDRAPWRQRPAFCLDVRIGYEDGSIETVSTDASWKTQTGPVIFNSIYTGEHYDSRLEIPGWNTAGFDDSKWRNPALRSAPSRQIASQVMAPIKNVEEITPGSLVQFSDTNYVFDLGRNIAGVVKIKLRGDSGTIVRIIHGERLYRENTEKKGMAGHVDLSNIDVYHKPKDDKDPFQTDIVVLNGRNDIEFMPKFNYKGFQYVEIKSSKPIRLQQDDLTGYFMHSDVSPRRRDQFIQSFDRKIMAGCQSILFIQSVRLSHRLPSAGKKRVDG